MTLLEEYADTDLLNPGALSQKTYTRLVGERTRNLLELTAILEEKCVFDDALSGKRDLVRTMVASRAGKRMVESARRVEKTTETLTRDCRVLSYAVGGLAVLTLIQIGLIIRLLTN